MESCLNAVLFGLLPVQLCVSVLLLQLPWNKGLCALPYFYLELFFLDFPTDTLSWCCSICCRSVAQSCQSLCDPMDCSPPGSSVHGTLQARILECVAMPFSRDRPHPGIEPGSPVSPALAAGVFTTEPPGKPALLMGFPGGSDGEEPASNAEDPGTSSC